MAPSLSKLKISTKDKASQSQNVDVDDIDEVDDQGQNVLLEIIKQLRPGCDLARITLPTFILERKSMLERIANQLQEPEILVKANSLQDPLERFVEVVRWYMSGWHISPKAVKKPLNPVLGEFFTCYWDLSDGKQAYYIAEQTSHHPPKSSYFYMIPDLKIRVDGIVIPKSKFLGNSTEAQMDGVTKLTLAEFDNETYTLTQPNMYARGILFGRMKFELGDSMVIKCERNGFEAGIDFKVKGFIGGGYNAIQGYIKDSKTGETIYEITGKWNEIMYIKNLKTNESSVFFDCSKANPLKPKARDISEQGQYESRKLWHDVIVALAKRDHEVATNEKFKIEDEQRLLAKKRAEDGVEYYPKLFTRLDPKDQVDNGDELLEYIIYKDKQLRKDINDPEKLTKDIFEVAPILPGQKFSDAFEIPGFHKDNKDNQEQQVE
ncbi:hypothetical protein PACTADRAFT_3098 [Pachysolen tannophilus NRRL Y-2460]|uniref:Oxysterol-binding protein n=1 Tax=Pachysolen tannophilus NRRL Y-2460 TaxID=669874 RepID=A0A1E4TUJ2_PACTA|nr:hypothetical protein PACTADRAFT_3098 [Pachysolen tannophilus NRRL Y-2460]